MEGEGHCSYSYDFDNTDGISELVNTIVADNGRLDGMVYAAGIEKTLPFKLLKPSDYEEVMKVNTISALETVRCVSNFKNFNKLSRGE